jgi:hypothetical protein
VLWKTSIWMFRRVKYVRSLARTAFCAPSRSLPAVDRNHCDRSVIAGLVWRGVPFGVWAIAASVFLCGFIGSSFRFPGVWVPHFPLGGMTELLRKDLKQFLTALDLYCTSVIAAPATYLRISGKLPATAHLPLTCLIVLSASTMALTLFGLDGDSSAFGNGNGRPRAIRSKTAC